MSKPAAVPAHAIPTGILVSVSGAVRKPERPVLKRKVAPRTRARQVPWLWIVAGGSAAWALLILAIGLCTPGHKSSPRGEPQAEAQPIPSVTTAPALVQEPSAQAKAAGEPRIAKPVVEPVAQPIVEAPKPVVAEVRVVKNDEATPAIPISTGMVETINFDERKPPESKVAQVAPPLARKDMSPFANCEQIGTNILFMKNPPEVFKQAKAENKLVFMVHLSGNLEDPGFT